MPCDRKLKPKQTITERKAEIVAAVEKLAKALVAGTVKAIVGAQGAIAFSGWAEKDRDGVTDSCAFRRLMVSGSSLAKAKIEQAERLAGRSVDKQAISAAEGWHSHDGGKTFHHGH